ncbi:dihydroorotase [Ginsengibacter hankyongi]|uniref:Dihydroorotase n=1 Tax=Ginsengibacter hankyongi TaxID=2607284 RepID=A0A5J5IDM8_9BACT|nr:dihydroorotase [Ginsengibacter hankyongi]KAA9036650.1 dihydroorotase [Ginsengibacter hankyongi]
MKVLIKRATIVSPSSPFHGTSQDILIDNGIISEIGNGLKANADKTIEVEDLHISTGWIDCFANFCDSGQEFKETLETGANAAAAGGFTRVMLIPNTNPVVYNKSQVEYLVQKSKHLPVQIFPIGSVTKNAEGKELSEMYDMFNTGAIAFSDGLNPVQSSGILQKALEYILAIDGTIIQLPDDKSISPSGLMNEGETSTRLGLAGKPAISEELMIARDIELVRYTNSKIHFTGVSTAKSIEMIAAAKNEKLRVTCSVTPYHLFFCDDDLASYDTNLKVNPPLRTKQDRDALRNGIKNGVIDFIASHHQPQDWDNKVCEFEYAKNGMEGLESVFGAARVCGVSAEHLVKMQTENIRDIFKIEETFIDKGRKANITLFNPDAEYVFEEKDIFSKSKNNGFIGKKLKGRVIGIINGDSLFLK